MSPEGQEKLFTFLDQGIIYRMGETNRPIPVTCRLCFATTEEISSTFLTTFLRRIPIQIKIPSLAERTQAERKQLIMRAFYEEQQAIQKAVTITPQVIQLLENHHYVGNVGELRNNIKLLLHAALPSILTNMLFQSLYTIYRKNFWINRSD